MYLGRCFYNHGDYQSHSRGAGSMTKHAELIARLEGGETGIIIDGEVFRCFGCPLPGKFANKKIDLEWTKEGRALMALEDMVVSYTPPAFSTSLDAALALVDRVRPEWEWSVNKDQHGAEASLDRPWTAGAASAEFEGRAPTPAAALICALLKAEGG
jgi:hypothetical protein